MKNKITNHEEKYLHSPKRALLYFLLTIILIGICVLFYKATYSSWIFLELGKLECSKELCSYFSHQLLIIPLLILDYIIISLTIISFCNIFKKVKRYDEEGLIRGLILGLIAGLMWGLIGGLIVGLIVGLIGGLIMGLIE